MCREDAWKRKEVQTFIDHFLQDREPLRPSPTRFSPRPRRPFLRVSEESRLEEAAADLDQESAEVAEAETMSLSSPMLTLRISCSTARISGLSSSSLHGADIARASSHNGRLLLLSSRVKSVSELSMPPFTPSLPTSSPSVVSQPSSTSLRDLMSTTLKTTAEDVNFRILSVLLLLVLKKTCQPQKCLRESTKKSLRRLARRNSSVSLPSFHTSSTANLSAETTIWPCSRSNLKNSRRTSGGKKLQKKVSIIHFPFFQMDLGWGRIAASSRGSFRGRRFWIPSHDCPELP